MEVLDVVDELRKELVELFRLSQGTNGSLVALESALDNRTETAQVERLVRRAESDLAALRQADERFRTMMQKGLASPHALKAKKLKTDYERKLEIAPLANRGQALLKRSRLWLVEKKKQERMEAQRVENAKSAAKTSDEMGSTFVVKENQVQFVLREYDDNHTKEMEQAELRNIAKNATLVREMASEVGSLLEVQQDDVNKLEGNTDDSVSRAIDGVQELSKYRKRQAGSGTAKAGMGTAAVGGLVGIVGGPLGIALGAAAGGFIGTLAGKGVAAAKKRSINAELRRIKALLGVRKRTTGEYFLEVQAFEMQLWSYMQRAWSTESSWRDEFGEPLQGAHPGNELSPAEARLVILAAARSGASQVSENVQEEVAAILERELKEKVCWAWASTKWTMVLDRPESDLGGWSYGSSPTSDEWISEAKRGSVCRRRLWVRHLIGKPERPQQLSQDPSDKSPQVQWLLDQGEDEEHQLWSTIYTTSVETNSIMSESLQRVNQQGEQIMNSERNATVVGDVAMYSERINRAAYLSGAIRNMLTWSNGKMSETESYAQELEYRRKVKQQELEASERNAKMADNNGRVHISEATSRTMEQNKMIASRMADELDVQNTQLDRTATAIERGNVGMLKITKSIK